LWANAETVFEEFDVFFLTFIHENTHYKIDIQIEENKPSGPP